MRCVGRFGVIDSYTLRNSVIGKIEDSNDLMTSSVSNGDLASSDDFPIIGSKCLFPVPLHSFRFGFGNHEERTHRQNVVYIS